MIASDREASRQARTLVRQSRMSSRPLVLALALAAATAHADQPPPPRPPPPADAGEPTVLVGGGELVLKSEDALTAWNGTVWQKVLVSSCPRGALSCYARADKEACLTLAPKVTPLAATVDLDGDGENDVLVDVECTSSDDTMCGTLALVRAGGCLRATGFLHGAKVSIHKAGKPPELLVSTESQDSSGWSETVAVMKDGGWQTTLTRDCDRKKGCGKLYQNRKRKGDLR